MTARFRPCRTVGASCFQRRPRIKIVHPLYRLGLHWPGSSSQPYAVLKSARCLGLTDVIRRCEVLCLPTSSDGVKIARTTNLGISMPLPRARIKRSTRGNENGSAPPPRSLLRARGVTIRRSGAGARTHVHGRGLFPICAGVDTPRSCGGRSTRPRSVCATPTA